MVLGIGIDLVETSRVARALESHGERFERKVFTPREIADSKGRPNRPEHLAARWAAKEAFLKAVGTGWADGLSPREVEVVRGEGRPPSLSVSGGAADRVASMGVKSIHLSLTHEGGYAAAVVILEG